MNSVNLIGRLARDAERKEVGDATVARFTLAVDRNNKSKDTDWIDCECWDKTADVVLQYVHKGDRIGVSGSLRTRTYEKDGAKHKVYEVNVQRVDLLGSRKDDAQEGGASDGDEPAPF